MNLTVTRGIAHNTDVYCPNLGFMVTVRAGTSHVDFGQIVMLLGDRDSNFKRWSNFWTGINHNYPAVRIDEAGYAEVIKP